MSRGPEDSQRSGSRVPWSCIFQTIALLSLSHDQHGHSVPSTSAIASLVASAASSAVGRSSSVAFSISGVRNVMYRDIVDWATSKMSAHTSSMIFCRRYPQVTISASRKVNSRGRPSPYPTVLRGAC